MAHDISVCDPSHEDSVAAARARGEALGFSTEAIPDGVYCYAIVDGAQQTCPYWGVLEADPESGVVVRGYCAFLKCGDGEDGDDGEQGTSLLFDMVKECGERDDPADDWFGDDGLGDDGLGDETNDNGAQPGA